MYGARIRLVRPPHRAARQDRARRPRPRRRLRYPPAWPADERLADRNLRSRLAVLAGTVRRVGGPAHEPRSAGRYRPRAWHVLAAGVEPDGPVDADGDQALVIYEARHPTVLPGGEAARPWDTANRGARATAATPPGLVAPSPMIPTWSSRVNDLAAKDGITSSGP